MRDQVAEVLAQRAKLDRGPAGALAMSILLHAGLTAGAVYLALHAAPAAPARMVSIQFASIPGQQRTRPAATPAAAKPASAPRIEPPQPVIQEPKPEAAQAAKPEKNTVPFSPFGRSTKKGSETPEVAKPVPAPPASEGMPGASAADVPVGGSGVAGLEGGDFPYTLYIAGMQRRIGANWFRPGVAAGTSVVIYYRILRDGTIAEAKVETSSGNPTFDRAALSAVRSSSPLNPLPFGYTGNYLGVHLIFR